VLICRRPNVLLRFALLVTRHQSFHTANGLKVNSKVNSKAVRISVPSHSIHSTLKANGTMQRTGHHFWNQIIVPALQRICLPLGVVAPMAGSKEASGASFSVDEPFHDKGNRAGDHLGHGLQWLVEEVPRVVLSSAKSSSTSVACSLPTQLQ